MQKWLKASLHRRRVFIKSDQLLGVSWDAFCFCLDAYRNIEVPLPSHFTKNIEYFVIQCLNKKNKNRKKREKNVSIDEDEGIFNAASQDLASIDVEGMKIISGNAFLSDLRKSPDKEYKAIFDDALTGSNREFKNFKKSGANKYLPIYRYNEAKKVFRTVIMFLLTGENE
jgi:hypothetical protein